MGSEGARVGHAPDSGNAGDERPVQPAAPSGTSSAAQGRDSNAAEPWHRLGFANASEAGNGSTMPNEREEQQSAAQPRFKAITRALEGIGALNDLVSNPDRYCACMGDAKCFLHGVTIPEGIKAAESLLAELKGASRV